MLDAPIRCETQSPQDIINHLYIMETMCLVKLQEAGGGVML